MVHNAKPLAVSEMLHKIHFFKWYSGTVFSSNVLFPLTFGALET